MFIIYLIFEIVVGLWMYSWKNLERPITKGRLSLWNRFSSNWRKMAQYYPLSARKMRNAVKFHQRSGRLLPNQISKRAHLLIITTRMVKIQIHQARVALPVMDILMTIMCRELLRYPHQAHRKISCNLRRRPNKWANSSKSRRKRKRGPKVTNNLQMLWKLRI